MTPGDSETARWWDASLIEATVTRKFVCEHLSLENVERLDELLGFGDGLTDRTYWEWIDEKAKRIFLILLDLGLPSHIFRAIDDSWDDDDLPISLDQLARLVSSPGKDDKLAKRFFGRQFHYLVKYIDKGKHVVYGNDDIIPVCLADRRPGLAPSNNIDRVELPNKPGQVFARRRFHLGTGPGSLTLESLMNEINSARNLQNDHLASYYGSYMDQEYLYVIFSHSSDFSLKTLLTTSPRPLKSPAKAERRRAVMNWIHCLTDTLCYIHKMRRSHGNIKPSTILFCHDDYIFYASMTRLGGEACASAPEKSTFDRESYDFAAPEQWYRPSTRKATMPQQSSASSSSESATFSISRGGPESGSSSGNASSAQHTSIPLLDPQAADIFSLGCVILELISLQLKRSSRSFASHRAAKHKLAGRGGAVLDSSFHKNLGQVESWMAGLAKDASKKDDPVFRGIAPMLHVVARMLAAQPQERPTAPEVEQAIYKILTERCEITEPHCVHQYGDWDLGLGNMRINSQSERFSIATKKQGGAALRPGSRTSGYNRMTGHFGGDMAGPSRIGEDGSGSNAYHMMRGVHASQARSNDWQPPIHTDNHTYIMGAN
ncbi:protein kinase [Poronia punctata]|nr:protein kinase [Poronia punctata]